MGNALLQGEMMNIGSVSTAGTYQPIQRLPEAAEPKVLRTTMGMLTMVVGQSNLFQCLRSMLVAKWLER